MKIGILTFHRALNYGALLQAYALQQILLKEGYDAEILDYRNPVIESAYYYPKLSERRDIKSIVKYFIQGKQELERRKKFDDFREKVLCLSKSIYTDANLYEANREYDLFVVGSDQVWNYQAHNFDENYFLKFVNNNSKKASFAASVGLSTLSDSQKNRYYELLRDFSICSVREQIGANLLGNLGISTRTDLDPSFLLTKDEWKESFNLKKSEERFIFAYYFELTPTLKSFIENLANETGCIIRYFGTAIRSPFCEKSSAIKTADPIDFVESIYNAEYVVTNSFHGTAFSINFNKKFYVELLQKDEKVNSRLIDILGNTNMFNRQIKCFNDITQAIESDINWEDANKFLIKQRNESKKYISEGFKCLK